ncbi:MAG TPA: SMP-30/gluconolactonase/LRE family protein [Jatrophihabitans sp.]|jgi:sugar lactone lactonase YvrE
MPESAAGRRSRAVIDPVVWSPPPAPPRARLRASTPPAQLSVFPIPGVGGEDVSVDADGTVLTGVSDGRILRISADGESITTVADTSGRPLGLARDPDGRLIVCDAERGLLRVDLDDGIGPDAVEVLLDHVAGEPIRFCSNAVAAADGTIYLTESTRRFSLGDYKADLLEHRGTGRLIRLDTDGSVTVLMDDLHFANGVALAADESFLLVAQTGAYSVERLWLTGERSGRREPFVANLPAFPDNLALGTDGLFWLALPSTRNATLDFLSSKPPVLRKIAWALPAVLQPREAKTVFVQAFDNSGTLVHDLQTSHPDFHFCTGVAERDGVLWLGSLLCSTIARIAL